jgi:hypothetical protein
MGGMVDLVVVELAVVVGVVEDILVVIFQTNFKLTNLLTLFRAAD